MENIIKNATLETGKHDIITVGYLGSEDDYSISFYGEKADNYNLVVEEFGRMYNGLFFEMIPTKEQILEMNLKLIEGVTLVREALEMEAEECSEPIADYYNYYGVSRKDFY